MIYPKNALSTAERGYCSILSLRYKGPAKVTEKLYPLVEAISDMHGKKYGKYHINDSKTTRKNLKS